MRVAYNAKRLDAQRGRFVDRGLFAGEREILRLLPILKKLGLIERLDLLDPRPLLETALRR